MLSKKRLDAAKIWDVIETYKDEKTVVEGVVTEVNKGGVVVGLVDQFGIPVRYLGVGEGIEDLREFDRDAFVATLFDEEELK